MLSVVIHSGESLIQENRNFHSKLAQKLPFYYGWTIVASSFMAMFVSNGMAFWGLQIFVSPIQDDTGWTRTSIMSALTIRWLIAGFGGLLTGFLLDRRHGPLAVYIVGVLIDGLSMICLFWVETEAQFVLLFGVIGGIGSVGSGRLIAAALVPKWFISKRGIAMGVAATGSGLSAALVSPIANEIVTNVGWREGWVWLGFLTVILLLPFSLFIRRSPEDIGLLPDGDKVYSQLGSNSHDSDEHSVTVSKAMKSPALWLLTLSMSIGLFSMSTNASSMVPFFQRIGFSGSVAASGLSIYGLFSIISRFFWGYVADRYTVKTAIIFQSILTSVGIVFYLSVQSQTTLFLAAAYHGLVLGGFVVLNPLIWPAYFGRLHLGAICGITQFFTTFALAAGPIFAGFIYDATDAYTWAYRTLVASWIITALVIILVRPVSVTR